MLDVIYYPVVRHSVVLAQSLRLSAGPGQRLRLALAVVFLVPVKRAVVSMAPAKKSSREIREWAIGAGHEVSSRGRISVEIERAFHDAQLEMPVA